MRKNVIVSLLTSALLILAAAGCGKKENNSVSDGGTANETFETEAVTEDVGMETGNDTEDGTSLLKLGNAVEIPTSFDTYLAETDAHKELEQAIVEYCKIKEEDYKKVRYYYNYVDLNEDGKQEILALALGSEVEGMEGDMLFWLDEADKEDITAHSIRQTFRNIGVPIYISNHMTEGYKDLILVNDFNDSKEPEKEVEASNAGRTAAGEETSLGNTAGLDDTTGENSVMQVSLEPTYSLLTWKGDKYQTLEEGTILFNIIGYEGTAILTNNTESALTNDNYHVLGEGIQGGDAKPE